MNSRKLEDLINILKSHAEVHVKKDAYLQTQKLITQEHFSNINEKLLPIIQMHLKEHILVDEALTTWILCAKISKDVQGDLIKTVYNHRQSFDQLSQLFCELLKENLLDIDEMLSAQNSVINKQLLESLGKISDDIPFKLYLDFINKTVVNVIFNTRNDDTRKYLIDFVLSKRSSFSISFYTSEEQKHIANLFKTSYIKVIDDLRRQNNRGWYNLCMFTMKYCGKLLHTEIEIMNMILHNVEIGFKTKTVQDRLLSYECWKVLIDTCNLDHNYICNMKQLRLLVKPLKVKLSKNEEIVKKRFEVWFYLAHILQQKLLSCLNDFLKFSFELQNEDLRSEICIDNSIIKNTYVERNEALSAVIGHYGHDGNCAEVRNFVFASPIVNSVNFLEFDTLLINSAFVMCKMISKWDDDSKKIMKVKCIWGSIFKLIQGVNQTSKESVLHKISKVLHYFLQDSINNKKYFVEIVVPIFSLLSSFHEPICNTLLLHEILIFPIIRFMLQQEEIEPAWTNEVIALVQKVPKTGNKLFYFNRICDLLKTSTKACSTFPIYFWLQLAEDLYDLCKMPREGFSDYKEDAMFFLTWIFYHSNLEGILDSILCTWKKIFSEVCTISSVFGEDLLNNCAMLIQKNPETVVNLLIFLPDIAQILLNNKNYKRYVMELLNVTSLCLQNPLLPKQRVIMTVPILKKVLSICTISDNIESISVITKVYECMESLLRPHQVLEILQVFKDVIPKLNINAKKKVPNSLKQVLNDLSHHSDILVSQDATFCLDQIEIESKNKEPPLFIRPSVSTRSARIANMAKDNVLSFSPKANRLKTFAQKSISPINTLIKPRSKKLDSKTKALPSQANNSIFNIDDDNAEYVLIDKEVRVDKGKLSEHQKEVMDKRREDIPALYQDLSRSRHSSDNSNSYGATQNKIELTVDDNFKDISDLRKKTDTLQENVDAELEPSPQIENDANRPVINSVVKDAGEIGLPKCELNPNFESNLIMKQDEECSKEIKSYNTDITDKPCLIVRNRPVFCFSKFEENVKTEAAQAPVFPDHDLNGSDVAADKNLTKKQKTPVTKTKLIRNRRMSDSHLVLQKGVVDDVIFGLTDGEDNSLEDQLGNGSLTTDKRLKTKSKEFRSKIREKHRRHLTSNKHGKICQLPEQTHSYECWEETLTKPQVCLKLKKKYRSLDNLSDIDHKVEIRKAKKCFKIIQNNTDVSNSIKLRISITEEDNDPGSDIIQQLDSEISKIDAHLQSSACMVNKKTSPSYDYSESIFGSLDVINYNDSQALEISDMKASDVDKDKIDPTNVNVANYAVSQICVEENTQLDIPSRSDNRKDEIIQKRKQRELDRIRMDIVGADQFIVTTPRKRRTPKTLEASPKNETPSSGKQSDQSTSQEKLNKKKNRLPEEKIPAKVIQKAQMDKSSDDSLNKSKILKNRNVTSPQKIIGRLNGGSVRKSRNGKTVQEVPMTGESMINCEQTSIGEDAKCQNENKRRRKKNMEKEVDAPLENLPQIKLDNSGRENSETSAGLHTPTKRRLSQRRKRKSLAAQLSLSPANITASETKCDTHKLGKIPSSGNQTDNMQDTASSANIETEVDALQNSEDLLKSNDDLVALPVFINDNVPKLTNLVVVEEDNTVITKDIASDDTSQLQEDYEHKTEISAGESSKEDSLLLVENRDCKILDKGSDDFICEINGLVINEFNSEGSDITICEADSVFDKESINEKDDCISTITKTFVNAESIISSSDNIVDNNSEMMHIGTEEYIEDAHSVSDKNETLTCDPYINIRNEEDVAEKMEKHCPGAIRTVIKDLTFDSLPFVFDTPRKENIPCSPICDDTPDRNKEFLSNTSNISPIKLEFAESELLYKEAKPLVNEKSSNNSSIKMEFAESELIYKDSKPLVNEKSCIKKASSRSAKLLNLVPNSGDFGVVKPPKRPTRVAHSETSTPTTQRIRQMISNCGKLQTPTENQDEKPVDTNCDIDSAHPSIAVVHNILTFTRELPSPFATPNSSILKKRKCSEMEDNASPFFKRTKRVNFSDPPITSQKIYFMECSEKLEHADTTESEFSLTSDQKPLKTDSIYPKLVACPIDISDVVDLLNQNIVQYLNSVNIRTVGDLADLNDQQIGQLDFLGMLPLNRITDILDVIYLKYGTKEKVPEKTSFPICPDLIDCTDSIQNILKFLQNCNTVKHFRLNNITTIGDLAKLTRAEVLQLPFEVSNILNALHKYQRRLNKRNILAKQIREEMNELDVEAVNVLDVADGGVTSNTIQIEEHLNPENISSEPTDDKCGSKTVEEVVEYLKKTYNRDELCGIFSQLKDIL